MQDGSNPGFTRRSIVVSGAGTLGAVSGCLGLGDFQTTESDPSSGTFRYPIRSPHDVTQFNPWLSEYPRAVQPLFYAYRSVQGYDEEWRFEYLIKDVEIDGSTAIVGYSDSYSWWNGEPVTARDDLVRLRLQSFMQDERQLTVRHGTSSGGVEQFDFEVTLLNEYTLEYSFSEALNPRIIRRIVLGGNLITARWLFQEWLDRLQDAPMSEDRKDILEEFSEWRIPFSEMKEQGFGCGPFRPETILEPRVECLLFEDHPYADHIEIEQVDLLVARDLRIRQMLVTDQLDTGQLAAEDLEDALPAHIDRLDRYPMSSGTKLLLNWRGHLSDRHLRWAIVAALPFENAVANGNLGYPATTQTGLGGPAEERWLSEQTRDALYSHSIEPDLEEATRLLTAAGFQRTNDRWQTSDGERLELQFKVPTREEWTVAAQTIEETLETMGIEVSTTPLEFGTYYSHLLEGNFDLAMWFNAGEPLSVYDIVNPGFESLGYGIDDPEVTRTFLDKPISPRIPSTVSSPNEAEESVNLVDHWFDLRTAATEKFPSIIDVFARWWNYDIPDIQLADDVTVIWGNTDQYEWPSAGDPALRLRGGGNRPALYALTTGGVRPRE